MGFSLEQTLSEAYEYITPRDRTIAEVRRHLEQVGTYPELIDAAIAELTERGYLDDVRYARCFAEDRRNLDSWGRDRIYRRLLHLGIDQELAEQFSRPEDPEQELRAAVGLLRRRMRCPPTDPRARQKAVGILVRRGYSWDLAYTAVRRFEEPVS
jgi:regulatory protein